MSEFLELKYSLIKWRRAEIEHGGALLRSAHPNEIHKLDDARECALSRLRQLVDSEPWSQQIEEKHMKSTISLAPELYDLRDEMRRVFGDRYLSKIEDYQKQIRSAMETYSLDEMQATQKLIARLKSDRWSDVQQNLLLSAFVEIMDKKVNTFPSGCR